MKKIPEAVSDVPSATEDNWRIREDASRLLDVSEIARDPKRHTKAIRHLKRATRNAERLRGGRGSR